MGALLFSHIRGTNVKLINEKTYLIIAVSVTFLSYLACFAVSTYVMFIWVCRILMVCESWTAY